MRTATSRIRPAWRESFTPLRWLRGSKPPSAALRSPPRREVLGAAGEPIPGLYAAGEVTGGVHGAAALPGQ